MKVVPAIRTGLRFLLGGVFVYAGVLHFTKTPMYESVMPPYLPYHRALVFISGACEIAGGLGVPLPFPVRRWAGWGLIALLIAVFPANVNMALHGAVINGAEISPLLLWARLPFQAVLIAWVWWGCVVEHGLEEPRTDGL